MPQQQQQADNLWQLLAGFADNISQRLMLADELAKEHEEEMYKRDIDRQDFELERQYKQAQIADLNKPPTEKSFAPPSNLEGYATGKLSSGVPATDIMSEISGLQGMFNPPKPESDDVESMFRKLSGEAFIGGRKTLRQPLDEYGTPSGTAREVQAPFTKGAADSLMAILSGQAMPQDTTGTGQQTIQGFPLEQARSMGRGKRGFGPDGSFPTQEEYEDAKRRGLVK